MKRTISLLMMLSVMACSKTNDVQSKKLQSTSPDKDIASMQTLIRQVSANLLKAGDLHELQNGVTESELSTLAPKMGLTISQAKEWFEQFNVTAQKLHLKFPDGKIKHEQMVGNMYAYSPYTDCQATAEGVFCGAVAACATAAAASTVLAPFVMSACGAGALIVYVVQMNACDTKYGCPCV